jgi:hypothetical protein
MDFFRAAKARLQFKKDGKLLLRIWLRGLGIVLILVGVISFPLGSSLNPERSTSSFYFLADLGILFEFGFLLAVIGALLVVIGFVIPAKLDSRR